MRRVTVKFEGLEPSEATKITQAVREAIKWGFVNTVFGKSKQVDFFDKSLDEDFLNKEFPRSEK